MKYLILEIERIPGAILFAEHLRHIDVAVGVSKCPTATLVSAGFCKIEPALVSRPNDEWTAVIQVEVFGASTLLNLSSRPEDAEIIFSELSGNHCKH